MESIVKHFGFVKLINCSFHFRVFHNKGLISSWGTPQEMSQFLLHLFPLPLFRLGTRRWTIMLSSIHFSWQVPILEKSYPFFYPNDLRVFKYIHSFLRAMRLQSKWNGLLLKLFYLQVLRTSMQNFSSSKPLTFHFLILVMYFGLINFITNACWHMWGSNNSSCEHAKPKCRWYWCLLVFSSFKKIIG